MSDRDVKPNQEEPDREPLVQYEDLEQATGFTQISNAVLRCYPELSDGEKITYAVLKSFAYVGPETFVGEETLARARGITVSTVSRHLGRLIEVGLVKVRRRGQGKTNIWIIARVPREKLQQYIREWRPNLHLPRNPQTKTMQNPQIKTMQNPQAKTSQDSQAEEDESDKNQQPKKNPRRERSNDNPLSLRTELSTASEGEGYGQDSFLAVNVENLDGHDSMLSTIVENADGVAELAVQLFGVPHERRSIETFLTAYDPEVAMEALQAVLRRIQRGEAIGKPIAYFYAVVKGMQAEADERSAERTEDDRRRRAVAASWARSLLREWPPEHVRAILADSYHSAEFVDAVMDEVSGAPPRGDE
ncbi:MAG: ArsR/SmtB family transcription factor [Armatimonadota bacterium]